MARALRTLDPTLVRRLAVSRQRLTGPVPAAAGPEEIMSVAADLGSLQLDPISVVARSHLLVLWSRLGAPADAPLPFLGSEQAFVLPRQLRAVLSHLVFEPDPFSLAGLTWRCRCPLASRGSGSLTTQGLVAWPGR
jgi:hypothetical protein